MPHWIIWIIVALGFVLLVGLYGLIADLRGRLAVLYDLVQTLRNTPKN